MERRKYTLIGALLLCGTLMAQPRFVAENKTMRVGELMWQNPKTVTFKFTNKGNKPLVVSEVHPSCGCVDVQFPRKPIASGKTGEITAIYDARTLGTFHRELAVYSNAQDEPVYLSFEGRVVSSPTTVDFSEDFPVDLGNVRLNSSAVEFDDVNKGDRPVVELEVVNVEKGSYTPQLMHLPAYLEAEYIPQTIQGGRVGKIRLTLNSDKLMLNGLNQTNVYLARYMGDKVGEENEIVVSAVLLPSFGNLTAKQMERAPHMVLMEGEEMLNTKSNATLRFQPQGKKTKLTKIISVTNIGEEPLKISGLQVFNRAVSVSLANREIPKHGTTKLKITLDTRELGKAKNKPRVLLISNDPRQAKTVLNVSVDGL